jgi:hypothetical protein
MSLNQQDKQEYVDSENEEEYVELLNKLSKKFIIPAVFRQSDFEVMENWKEGKMEAFKEYMLNAKWRNFLEEDITNTAEQFLKDVKSGDIKNTWDAGEEKPKHYNSKIGI